jgi:hypothetical protein
MPKHSSLTQCLTEIRGDAPRSNPNTRTLAAFAGHADCELARAMFAAGVNSDKLLINTPYEASLGQSPFAFSRGNKFQDLIAEKGYAAALKLLQEKMGFQPTEVRIENIRNTPSTNRIGLKIRARQTKSLILEMVNGDPDAANLIDGAVLSACIGGVQSYFEADTLAARSQGVIHAGEIKSFPVVDDRADPEKLGSALDQVSIYIWLLYQLVEELGGDPTQLVSSIAMLITPKNVGLTPTLSLQNVTSKITRFKRLLASVPDIGDLVSAFPTKTSFGPISNTKLNPNQRIDELHNLADKVGTRYRPECLSNCGNARFCRERCFSSGSPSLAGPQLVRLLPSVQSLTRAADLSSGAPANSIEAPVATQLARAGRLYDEATK